MNGSLHETTPQVDVEAGSGAPLQKGANGTGGKGANGQGKGGKSPVNQHYGTVISLLQEDALEVRPLKHMQAVILHIPRTSLNGCGPQRAHTPLMSLVRHSGCRHSPCPQPTGLSFPCVNATM